MSKNELITQKNPLVPYKYITGRPRKYTSIKKLENTITEYFEITEIPTINGLGLFLGFTGRTGVNDAIARDDEFSTVLKRATHTIESMHEARLCSTQPAGSIFWLKNRGWQDKIVTEHQYDFRSLLEEG